MNADWAKPQSSSGQLLSYKRWQVTLEKEDHEAEDNGVQILLKAYDDSKLSKVTSEKH